MRMNVGGPLGSRASALRLVWLVPVFAGFFIPAAIPGAVGGVSRRHHFHEGYCADPAAELPAVSSAGRGCCGVAGHVRRGADVGLSDDNDDELVAAGGGRV